MLRGPTRHNQMNPHAIPEGQATHVAARESEGGLTSSWNRASAGGDDAEEGQR